MSSEIAITVNDLSKCYHIYDKPLDRLKQGMCRGRKKFYKEFNALEKTSFQVKKGETVGIIGRNGSGKSTLLQLICGTLTPTGGTVATNGRIAALLELGSGFNPEFTGRENIYMNATVLGLSAHEIESRFDDIAAFAELGPFLEQPLKTYSSGMVVRLAFSVIAHVDADILIIDEALSVGDAVFVQRCNRFIRDFREEGTLFFVSHSNQAILDLCDRAIWLDKGVCVSDNDAIDVVRQYNAFTHQQLNKGRKVSVHNSGSSEIFVERDNIEIDHRQNILEKSNLQYNLQLFKFSENSSSWGVGGAKIINVTLCDEEGKELSCIDKYMKVVLNVHCRATTKLARPVIGFTIRNYRGVELISENSHLSYIDNAPPRIEINQSFCASFYFLLPCLAPGEYFIGAAIADGSPGEHVQHVRLDEALKFSVTSSHIVYGLFSMPLTQCEITV